MSFRRDARPAVHRSAFLKTNGELAAAAGLPESYLDSEPVFVDFLMLGCLRGDPRNFSVHELTEVQFRNFVNLVREYFRYGYGYFTPNALLFTDLMRQFDEEFRDTSQ